MKTLLLHRDRDFELQGARPWNEPVLMQDLELSTLIATMAAEDKFLAEVAHSALLTGFHNDVDTILYRQAILRDCIANPGAARALYNLAVEAAENSRRIWWDLSSHYPDSVLYGAVSLLDFLLGILRRLRKLVDEATNQFHSQGFTRLFAMLQSELGDEYLAAIEQYLSDLKFRNGTLLAAELGPLNEGANYMLAKPPKRDLNWLKRLLTKEPPNYSFRLDPRDETGARIVSEMRHQGISQVAVTLAQSADHVLSFFKTLRTEISFYIGCLNLYDKLAAKQEPICFPETAHAGTRKLNFHGLYDVCLSLHMEQRVVGNEAVADGKDLIIITGANQGGKSSFLRSVGLAQTMMQCGMFVGAESFAAELCTALFTHYKREEDETMKGGKLDEELARMSAIADHITPNSLLLLNESFAATNEREGSEIASQITRAMLEKRIKVFFVTHLYEFAREIFDKQWDNTLFLRAERMVDGTRTFKLVEREPLETSYGEDLYREIFAVAGDPQAMRSRDITERENSFASSPG